MTFVFSKLKMVLFHIAAVGWISPQTGYEIQGTSYEIQVSWYLQLQLIRNR